MRKIGNLHKLPFYDYRCIRAILKRKAHLVNSKGIFHRMKQMGLMAIFPKLNLSKANKGTQDFFIPAARKGD